MLCCLLAGMLGGCTARTADPLVEAGQSFLRTARPPSDEAFVELNRFVSEQPDVAARAAAGLVEAAQEEVRYAAIYVLGLTAAGPADSAALKRALDDDAVHLRTIAAGSLIGLGDKDAIPVLIELLAETDEIPGSVPPMFVDRFSSQALTAYTGEDYGLLEATSGDLRTLALGRWRTWWDNVKDTLHWDPATKKYVR
jgi:hypothetical protein